MPDVNLLADLASEATLATRASESTLASRATESTALNMLAAIAGLAAQLSDIFGAVDGLELSADSIAINAETLKLNTDQLEALVQGVRDRLPTLLGQLARASSLSVVLATEQEAILAAIRDRLPSSPHAQPLTDQQLRAANVNVTVSNPTANPETGLAKDSTLVQVRDRVQKAYEKEFTPGLKGATLVFGSNAFYTAPAGKAFRVWMTALVPVTRGSEEPPIVTMKILNSDNSVFSTPMVVAAIKLEKIITGPVGGKIVFEVDQTTQVAATLDIEEFTP